MPDPSDAKVAEGIGMGKNNSGTGALGELRTLITLIKMNRPCVFEFGDHVVLKPTI